MKVVQLYLFLFAFITAAVEITAQQNGVQHSKVQLEPRVSVADEPSNRLKRQTETTTPKPKKPRPSNIFSLISVLLTETREDASRAFGEIGTLFNGQFSNATTPRVPSTSTATGSSSSGNDEDNEITTTTESYRISRDEFLGILRSNVQGIVNLFGKEFRVAIKSHPNYDFAYKGLGKLEWKPLMLMIQKRDSNQNAREFGRDLGVALRPYFYNNSSNNNSNKNNSKNNT